MKYNRSQSAKNINPKLTPEEIYSISKRENIYGIKEYNPPKKYIDFHQIQWEKKTKEILKNCKKNWPPQDWLKDKNDDKKRIPPIKKTYIYTLEKWLNSYYDPKKAEELKEKGIKIDEYIPKRFIDKIKRTQFLENEKNKTELLNKKKLYPEYKESSISLVKEKINEEQKKKKLTYEEQMKKKYKDRPQSSRCERITILDEASSLGEQIPFYNSYLDQKFNKKKSFEPNKEVTSTWKRSPSWKISDLKKENNENIKYRKEVLKEKVEEIMSQKNWSQKDLFVNIRKSFYEVNNHGQLLHVMHKKIPFEKEEHYKSYIEKNPKKFVGPQHYWKVPFEKDKKNNKFVLDNSGNKIYYMDRKKTDKRVYIPNLRKSIY